MKYKNTVHLDWAGKGQNENTTMTQEKRPLVSLSAEKVYPYLLNDDYVELKEILPANNLTTGRLIKGANIDVMQALINTGYGGKLDLIYLDPPYFSASNYHSKLKVGSKDNPEIIKRQVFSDSWKGLEAYLSYIYKVLELSQKLLSNQGSIFVHLDWHASHYVKILLDEVFCMDNFINEIIWCYGGGSNAKRHLQRKHDNIFWYGKSEEYIFNPEYRPYTEKTKERGLTKVKGSKYVLREHGALMQDWWIDINKILSPTAYENLKFPTQKPLALINRIIKMASNEDSLIGDFFLGSGTTAEAAELLKRNWIGCDNSNIAIQTAHLRLLNSQSSPYQIEGFDPANYSVPDAEIIFKPDRDGWFINLNMTKEVLNKNVAFWEIGVDEADTFCSLLQLVRHDRKNEDLLSQITIKNIPENIKKVAVKIHDFRGNTFKQEQPI